MLFCVAELFLLQNHTIIAIPYMQIFGDLLLTTPLIKSEKSMKSRASHFSLEFLLPKHMFQKASKISKSKILKISTVVCLMGSFVLPC